MSAAQGAAAAAEAAATALALARASAPAARASASAARVSAAAAFARAARRCCSIACNTGRRAVSPACAMRPQTNGMYVQLRRTEHCITCVSLRIADMRQLLRDAQGCRGCAGTNICNGHASTWAHYNQHCHLLPGAAQTRGRGAPAAAPAATGPRAAALQEASGPTQSRLRRCCRRRRPLLCLHPLGAAPDVAAAPSQQTLDLRTLPTKESKHILTVKNMIS